MLPSKGFFKKNDCPFFEKGLCVRPHCHFRHAKKKIGNDESSSSEIIDILSKPSISVNSGIDEVLQPGSSSVKPLKKEETGHDSLFVKLVNESNPYEKLNRHIPCAYTPTPQSRLVQPKKQSNGLTSAKSLEIINNARTYLKNVSNENAKNEQNKYLNSNKYKPEKIDDSLQGNASYVPSKATSSESKYVPDSSNKNLAKEYVPSKEKKSIQYVPETTGTTNNVDYKPSDKTLAEESKYQPDISDLVTDYIPSGKDVTMEDVDVDKGLAEIEFISSEIEMMKELLKDSSNSLPTDDSKKTEEKDLEIVKEENKSEEKKKDSSHHKRHSSQHKSSSKDKSDSKSHRHSSSSSSKSRSSSSKHSSSRHHSSSSSHRSSSKKSSSSSSSRHHRRKSSPEDKKSSSKSHKSPKHSKDDKYKKENGKRKEESESEEENDNFADSYAESESQSENSDTESKKRKNSRADNERNVKPRFSISEEEVNMLFDDVEDDPDVVEKQCLEIFNSYSAASDSETSKMEISINSEECESAMQAKKRTAHSISLTSDHSVLRDKTVKKKFFRKTAQEVMMERYTKTVETPKETVVQPPAPAPAPILGLPKPAIRIAAVSNIQQMLQAKKRIQDKINQGLKVNERTTIAQTVAPGAARKAHAPTQVKELKEKPSIKEGSKQISRIKRQACLEKLLIETNKIYPMKCESAEEALKLEEEIFRAHSGSLPAYHAAFTSLIVKTRRRVAILQGDTTVINSTRPKMSHSDVLSGGKKNFTVFKTKKVDISMLTEKHIYEELLRCKLKPEELKENGFPIDSGRPGYATCSLNYELKYNDKYQYIKKMSKNMRYCIRCSKQYEVDPATLRQYKEGPETCCYHPGKKKSGGRNSERVYNCCNTASVDGCATHVRHVTDCNDYENLPNCVKTLAKDNDSNPGVYALDCEMVYSRLGYELARITVVNLKKEVVYDTLVKPKYPVECYNSVYSGIEEKMMEGVRTSLKDVQAVLLSLFSNKTILIGHSLDSDLRALHLIHDTVVDTSVFYKNEKYFPYKYSLKDLSVKKINKIIQENLGGHDSTEDAIAALEIMLQHVKEEVGKYETLESYEADRAR